MTALDILHAEIGTITSRSDGSVSFRVITPELKLEQAAALIGYHGKAARVLVAPHEGDVNELMEVKTERDVKTPCQRLRAVIFLLFRHQGSKGDFESYYNTTMEKLIQGAKDKLDE